MKAHVTDPTSASQFRQALREQGRLGEQLGALTLFWGVAKESGGFPAKNMVIVEMICFCIRSFLEQNQVPRILLISFSRFWQNGSLDFGG